MINQIRHLPRIVLGDHGFLPQYGSRLGHEDIVARMRLALQHGIAALAAGDFHVTKAAMEAFDSEDAEPLWARHIDVPLSIGGVAIDVNPALSFLRRSALATFGTRLSSDPVMGPFFEKYAKIEPFHLSDCQRLQLDLDALSRVVEDIRTHRPLLVTAGGDILDFLIACERLDLVETFIQMCASAAKNVGAALHVCTYLGFGWESSFARVAAAPHVHGFMLTANSIGAGMVPSRDELLKRVEYYRKPISAMHVLMFGHLELNSAIETVLAWNGVQLAFIGASQERHIIQLAKAALRLRPETGG